MDAFFKWRPGIAAEPLEDGSIELPVFVPDILPMVSGRTVEGDSSGIEIPEIETKGGDVCSGYLEVAETVIATYVGRSNMTPPCIHKGETVLISESINGIFYWKEVGVSDLYRLREKVTFRIANKNLTVEDLSDDNTYYLTLNSIDKHITLATTMIDSDEFSYTFKFDVPNKSAFIKDSDGNSVVMKSDVPSITITNKNGTMMEVNKDNINMNAPKNMNLTIGGDFNISVANNLIAKIGSGLKITSPVAKADIGITTLDGTDLSITESTSTVITVPLIALNGFLNVATSILSNAIVGTVLSAGGGASTIQGAKIDITEGETETQGTSEGTASGASVPPDPIEPTDMAASYLKLTTMISDICSALNSLGEAIIANNNAHTGITTTPADGAVSSVAAAGDNVINIQSTIPDAQLSHLKDNSGA